MEYRVPRSVDIDPRSQTFSILGAQPQEQFFIKEEKKSNLPVILLVLAVIIAFYVVTNKDQCRYHMEAMPKYVDQAKKQVQEISSRFVRGMQVRAASSSDVFFEQPSKGNVTNLTPCNDEHCKTKSSQVKSHYTNQVKEFLKDKDAIVFIFAPWCGHCHNAIPSYYNASANVNAPCTLVNADLVDDSFLQEMKVTHFPYICMSANGQVKNVLKEMPTVESLKTLATN